MTSIREDLESILFNTQETGEVSIREKLAGKPGLDEEQGQYRIDGGLIIDKIQYRGGNGSNLVKTVGLQVTKIERTEDGIKELDTLYVTKEEAIDLALEFGAINAYVKTTIRKAKKRGEQAQRTHHLQPYPTRTESFTTDDKLVFVYEVDTTGTKVRPHNLLIEEEKCSRMMWTFLQLDFERRKDRDAKTFKGSSYKNAKKVKQLRGDIKNRRLGVIKNPFKPPLKEPSSENKGGSE